MKVFYKVSSSALKGLQHFEGDLYALFKGDKVYKYEDVERGLFHALLDADSIGKMFNKEVRNYFDCVELGKVQDLIFINDAE